MFLLGAWRTWLLQRGWPVLEELKRTMAGIFQMAVQRTIAFWAIVAIVLSVLTLFVPPRGQQIFGDVATHIMIASSIWHDQDLQYSRDDLERFRRDVPGAAGPDGLFLKMTEPNHLRYAKPPFYGIAASPFYALFGVAGFLVLNCICLGAFAGVSELALRPMFGAGWARIIVLGLVFPSPMLAWAFVPHPDLFIAALLAVGGYLVLRPQGGRLGAFSGAVLLGFACEEKTVFIVLVLFLLWAAGSRSVGERIALFGVVVATGLLLHLPNWWFDKSMSPYFGFRFVVNNAIKYPLEEGWQIPEAGMELHRRLSALNLLEVVGGNARLLPSKLFDFLVGRQTGIVPYFSVAFALLALRVAAPFSRSLVLIAGLFTFLLFNWLIAPSNGFGGSQSYGSRYLMQALALIPLSFVGATMFGPGRHLRIAKVAIVMSIAVAIVLQSAVMTRANTLVAACFNALRERPLSMFPTEHALAPTIFQSPLNSYRQVDAGEEHFIFDLHGAGLQSGLFWNDALSKDYLLYQFQGRKPVPALEIVHPLGGETTIAAQDKVVWRRATSAGQPEQVRLDQLQFDAGYFDAQMDKEARYTQLRIGAAEPDMKSKAEGLGPVLQFAREYTRFTNYDAAIAPHDFERHGLHLGRGWSQMEPWGVWSDGDAAAVMIRVGRDRNRFDIRFEAQGFARPMSKQKIKVLANGAEVAVVTLADKPSSIAVHVEKPEGPEFIHVLFLIERPVSPYALGQGVDIRRLGIGLTSLGIWRVKSGNEG